MGNKAPSWDEWMDEAKRSQDAARVGMYLCHTGVVREDSRAKVRNGIENDKPVTGMDFSYDDNKLKLLVEEAKKMPGIYYVKVWLNEGHLEVGEDIMHVLIGGDIRPHVVDALNSLVGKIKANCVTEKEKN